MAEHNMDFVSIMTNGRTVATQKQLLEMLPRTYNETTEGRRTFYRVGKFKGPVAAWDDWREIGVIRDDYRDYILAERAKRSER